MRSRKARSATAPPPAAGRSGRALAAGDAVDAAPARTSTGPSPAAAAATLPAVQPTDDVSEERRCEVCGNLYDKPLRVVKSGVTHVFDCFECAIHALAPVCSTCGCRIVGHGMESDGIMYCCAHCAQRSGIDGLKDRADAILPAS